MERKYNLETLVPCGCSHCRDWKKGFKKELEIFMYPTEMGEWIRKNSDTKTIGELLRRYIHEKILGEKYGV